MTPGFIASFGGLAVVFAALLLLEAWLRRPSMNEDAGDDVSENLDRAEAAAKEVEVELARLRNSLARH